MMADSSTEKVKSERVRVNRHMQTTGARDKFGVYLLVRASYVNKGQVNLEPICFLW